MVFLKYVFAPKLYKEYGDGSCQKMYEPHNKFEKWGDQVISTLSLMWNISYYSSPLLITFLYRRGYFVAESLTSLTKFMTGIGVLVVISLCMRGVGRSQSQSYVKFIEALNNYKSAPNNSNKKVLRLFDFDFRSWPIDFNANSIEDSLKKPQIEASRTKPFWISSLPCEIAAYIAVHTFGIRMIYPGSVKLLQHFFGPFLIQGRCKLVEEETASRNKLKTRDSNEIDTIFVDNRNKSVNGRILVICSEGNAGFYEIGIMSTPLSLQYSVMGWNHPGFAGSTGQPYPSQDQKAIDAVIQFAIHELNFTPDNIILFGWSIGGYTSLWAASQYPEIKGVILDATFDDILYLALPKMPEVLASVVKLAIRNYVNLNHLELINQYSGPVLMIRRTEDEIICTQENNIETNRGNSLLLNFLKYRFPNIFKPPQIAFAMNILSKPLDKTKVALAENNDELCMSLLCSYISDNDKVYPMLIGDDYNDDQRNQFTEYLIRKHYYDFKSTHCTPLPDEFFRMPWDIPSENDFVFT